MGSRKRPAAGLKRPAKRPARRTDSERLDSTCSSWLSMFHSSDEEPPQASPRQRGTQLTELVRRRCKCSRKECFRQFKDLVPALEKVRSNFHDRDGPDKAEQAKRALEAEHKQQAPAGAVKKRPASHEQNTAQKQAKVKASPEPPKSTGSSSEGPKVVNQKDGWTAVWLNHPCAACYLLRCGSTSVLRRPRSKGHISNM